MSKILQNFNNLSYSKEKLEGGKLQLNIEISNERFEIVKNKVYEKLASTVKVDGFRQGKAPKNIIIARLGPSLFEQTLNELVPQCTLEIIQREKLMPLDQISYKIDKIAEGSGVQYSATFTVFPEFKLPDISKIKVKKKEKIEIDEKEVEVVVKQMFNEKQKGVKGDKTKKDRKMNDEWAASLNLGVKNLKELKERIQTELLRQKKDLEKNKYISEVIDEISEKSKFEIPEILLEQEINKKEQEYKSRIENLGMKVEDFLRNQKTSIEELKKGWKKEADKVIRTEIILMKIANEYKIKVENAEVQKQIDEIKDEKLKAQYQNPQTKKHLQSILVRQKIVDKILELVGYKD